MYKRIRKYVAVRHLTIEIVIGVHIHRLKLKTEEKYTRLKKNCRNRPNPLKLIRLVLKKLHIYACRVKTHLKKNVLYADHPSIYTQFRLTWTYFTEL